MAHEYFKVGTTQALINAVKARTAEKPDSDALSPLLTAGAALGITGNDAEESAWLARTSGADGVASVRSIHGNTIVQDGELVSVRMEGIETVGFNQWDEQWEAGGISSTTGENAVTNNSIRSKNYISVIPGQTYYFKVGNNLSSGIIKPRYYDANKAYIGYTDANGNQNGANVAAGRVMPANCHYMRFELTQEYGTTYNHDICINLSDPTRNGEYEPYWQQQRPIPAGTLRGAGSVYDEQTETERITRVGVVDLGTLEWATTDTESQFRAIRPSDAKQSYQGQCANYDFIGKQTTPGDKQMASGGSGAYVIVHDSAYTTLAAFQAAMSGVMLHYELATPTVTPIDPPLNLTYRTETGGTERVMVPTGENSAPPTLVTAQGYTAESLRDAALSAIAPVENGKASTNYGVGTYLVHVGQLCKVTTAIATGEAITIGTNVTATTVMAEVIALIAQ